MPSALASSLLEISDGRAIMRARISCSRGQPVEFRALAAGLFLIGKAGAGDGKGGFDALDQIGLAERLFQKIHGAGLDRLHRFGNAAMAGDKDDRDRGTQIVQVLLQLQPIHLGHAVIQHQTARPARIEPAKKGRGRGVAFDQVAASFQRAVQGFADVLVIVDHKDGQGLVAHDRFPSNRD